MAITEAGTLLTEAHRVGQIDIQAEAVADLAVLWPLLDADDLDRSFPGFARAAMTALDLRREQSATLAAGYYSTFREIEGATTEFTVAALSRLADEEALATLLVNGPIEAKKTLARSRPTFDPTTMRPVEEISRTTRVNAAMDRALVTTAGAMMRLTADAGREVVLSSTARDRQAIGYSRVTDGSPCAFCAMLASRVNYKRMSFSDSDPRFSGKGTAKVHNHCGCTTEPVFGEGYKAPGRSDEFKDLWDSTGAKTSGDDAINAFRRAYERPHLHLP